jgi:hypothetical protein
MFFVRRADINRLHRVILEDPLLNDLVHGHAGVLPLTVQSHCIQNIKFLHNFTRVTYQILVPTAKIAPAWNFEPIKK